MEYNLYVLAVRTLNAVLLEVGRQFKTFTTREKSFLFLQVPGFLSHRNPFHAFIRDCFKITNWKLSFRSVRSQNGTSHLIPGCATSLCNLQTYTSYFLELHYYVPLVEDVDVIYFESFLKIRNFQLGEYRIIMSDFQVRRRAERTCL
jgi:hypothetical protein